MDITTTTDDIGTHSQRSEGLRITGNKWDEVRANQLNTFFSATLNSMHCVYEQDNLCPAEAAAHAKPVLPSIISYCFLKTFTETVAKLSALIPDAIT